MPPKKKVAAIVKVALNAGAATPAPPVGTALGPHGVNIMEFCKRYNAETEAMRGTIVPVIDLRLKLRLKEARYDAFTVMIVLNVEDRVVGIVVDSVSDVIALNAEQIRPTPEFGASVDTRFISGIGTVDDRMLILLDIETLIDSADFGQPLPEQVAA